VLTQLQPSAVILHDRTIDGLTPLPDGRFFVWKGFLGTLDPLHFDSSWFSQVEAHGDKIDAGVALDESLGATCSSADGTVRIWHFTSGQCTAVIPHKTMLGVPPRCLAVLNTHRLVSAGGSKVIIWDPSWQPLRVVDLQNKIRTLCVLPPDSTSNGGERLVCTYEKGSSVVLDPDTGAKMYELPTPPGVHTALALPDGGLITADGRSCVALGAGGGRIAGRRG
jgi:WD40 repeat protein